MPEQPNSRAVLKAGVFIAFTVISSVYFAYTQLKLEQKVNAIQAQQAFDNEHDFAIRLTGMRKNSEVMEAGMLDAYNQLSQVLEHCKKHRCELPPNLAVLRPLPQYVPTSALYLQQKEQNFGEK